MFSTRVQRLFNLLVFVSFSCCTGRSQAQVMLQGFYWDVPSPAAGSAAAPWWWDHLASQAQALRSAGITAVWLPPVLKAASGGYSVGYDPFDDYDMGSKYQKSPTGTTRYGSREQVERCVAILRANNMNCYLDLVENHRNGEARNDPFHFDYMDAAGDPFGGRFEKFPTDFHPNVPDDPDVPDNGPQSGRDLAHIKGKNRHVYDGLIDAVDWQTRALDVQGYRLDFVKGISTEWLVPFLNAKSMGGKFAVGEFWDTDRDKVERWIHDPRDHMGIEGRAAAFDFPLQHILRAMCGRAPFDMRTLDHAGLAGIDPTRAVTFVENHDTDRSDGNKIVTNKMLAYLYILTSEGYPCIFYRDYSTDNGCYHLQPRIDPLIKIHEALAKGAEQQRWMDQDLFVFERLGGRHLLVGMNRGAAARTITADTGFGPNVKLHDYAANSPDIITTGTGAAAITVPANLDGAGYICYAPSGIDMITEAQKPVAVTQDFEGAADLDIPPATEQTLTEVCRVYSAAGDEIRASLKVNTANWNKNTRILVLLQGPDGRRAESSETKSEAPELHLKASVSGFYRFTVEAFGLRESPFSVPFVLSVNYTAPKSL